MKRNIISIILGIVIGSCFGITALANQEPTTVYVTPNVAYQEEIPEEESEPRHITYAEKLLLAAVVYAEANTESLEGKRYVVDVILNRMDNPDFPNTLAGVIYQPYQFWTDGMPTDYDSIPNDIWTAIDMELKNQTDKEVIYFKTGNFFNFGTPVVQVGRHFFSK